LSVLSQQQQQKRKKSKEVNQRRRGCFQKAKGSSHFIFVNVITLFLAQSTKGDKNQRTKDNLAENNISQHFETNVDGRPATKADEISHNIHPLNTQQTESSNDRDFRYGGRFFFLIKIP
jgi:hypothetical protein